MWDSGSVAAERSPHMRSTMISVALAAGSADQPAATPKTRAGSDSIKSLTVQICDETLKGL
jgi:hypothetical protein